MSSRKGTYLQSLLLGLILSIGFFVLLIKQVDLWKSWEVLARTNFRLMPTPMLITLGILSLRPWRWQGIFPKNHRPSFYFSFKIFAIASAANNFFPGRAGDILRCFLITREHTLSGASLALATVGLEKLLDGIVAVVVVVAALFWISSPQWLARMGLFSTLAFGSAVGGFVLLHFCSGWVVGAIQSFFRTVRLPSLGERVVALVASFSEGLAVVSSPLQLQALILLTILIWAGEATLVRSLGLILNIPISFPAALLVMAVLGLGSAIPAAPASVGTYEFFAVAGLSLMGVRAEAALALAVLMHGWSFLTTSVLGLIGVAISNLPRAVAYPVFSLSGVGLRKDEKA